MEQSKKTLSQDSVESQQVTYSSGLSSTLKLTLLCVFSLLLLILIAVRTGLAIPLLILAGTSLLWAIYSTFRAIQSWLNHEDELDESFAEAAPTAAQQRKNIALQAIRDLEHERSIGNVNDKDFLALMARFREEAKVAMRALDEEQQEARKQAENLASMAIVVALGTGPKNAPDETVPTESTDADAPKEQSKVESTTNRKEDGKSCPSCDTRNDDDAKFCKSCGTTFGETP